MDSSDPLPPSYSMPLASQMSDSSSLSSSSSFSHSSSPSPLILILGTLLWSFLLPLHSITDFLLYTHGAVASSSSSSPSSSLHRLPSIPPSAPSSFSPSDLSSFSSIFHFLSSLPSSLLLSFFSLLRSLRITLLLPSFIISFLLFAFCFLFCGLFNNILMGMGYLIYYPMGFMLYSIFLGYFIISIISYIAIVILESSHHSSSSSSSSLFSWLSVSFVYIYVVAGFSLIYHFLSSTSLVTIAHISPTTSSLFSSLLSSFYFSLTVFTTCGFGDHHAVDNVGKMVVCGEMVMSVVWNVVIVAKGVEVIGRGRESRSLGIGSGNGNGGKEE